MALCARRTSPYWIRYHHLWTITWYHAVPTRMLMSNLIHILLAFSLLRRHMAIKASQINIHTSYYWSFARCIQRFLVDSPTKGQWCGKRSHVMTSSWNQVRSQMPRRNSARRGAIGDQSAAWSKVEHLSSRLEIYSSYLQDGITRAMLYHLSENRSRW